MKKILFILLVVSMSCVYGQARQSIPDTLRARRTAINLNVDSLSAQRTDINLKLSLGGGTLTGNLDFLDNVNARFGTGNDLKIYHDGSNSYINNATGILTLLSPAGSALRLGVNTPKWDINGTSYAFIPTGAFDLGSSGFNIADIYVDTVKADAIILGGTNITATGAELNFVDGVTSNIQTQLNARTTDIATAIDADIRVLSVPVLYPSALDTIPLLRIPENITVTSVYAGIKGGTSATYNVGWATSLTGTLEEVFAADEVCSSSVGAQAGGGLENSTPDAGEWIIMHVSAVSGTVKALVVTLTYTKR